ncbi:extensin family protein [Serratia sp. NPDC078593]|uniref:extensin-like domain-containing protein n=1 Tax=unclassified Serratia (in: enterobacteria) TaxID=2647522 RepID=UPI0037CCC864
MLRMLIIILILLAVVGGVLWLGRLLPLGYNPFTPLSIHDPPTFITRMKINWVTGDRQRCLTLLAQARADGRIDYQQEQDVRGDCPLLSPIRVKSFGQVKLSASFLASCRLALRSTMFVSQVAAPLAQQQLGSHLTRIDHLGSYACRNIYHRPEGRLSEHATANAWDISGFRLANGQRLRIEKDWPKETSNGLFLRRVFHDGCGFFGNSLGPEYNSAHANHFHFSVRGYGLCH